MTTETLCKLYLELSLVVPEGTKTAREKELELALDLAVSVMIRNTPNAEIEIR